MQTARTFVRLVLVAALVMPLVSCAFFAQLGAMRTFKEANLLYGRADYEGAIEEYGHVLEVIDADPESELSQAMTVAYFYIANSYDNLYHAGLQGQSGERSVPGECHRVLPAGGGPDSERRVPDAVDAILGGVVRPRPGQRPD